MKLEAIVSTSYNVGSPEQKVLKFRAQYDNTLPEDQRFQKATPSASAEFQVDNEAALSQFTVGKNYYFDIVPAD